MRHRRPPNWIKLSSSLVRLANDNIARRLRALRQRWGTVSRNLYERSDNRYDRYRITILFVIITGHAIARIDESCAQTERILLPCRVLLLLWGAAQYRDLMRPTKPRTRQAGIVSLALLLFFVVYAEITRRARCSLLKDFLRADHGHFSSGNLSAERTGLEIGKARLGKQWKFWPSNAVELYSILPWIFILELCSQNVPRYTKP